MRHQCLSLTKSKTNTVLQFGPRGDPIVRDEFYALYFTQYIYFWWSTRCWSNEIEMPLRVFPTLEEWISVLKASVGLLNKTKKKKKNFKEEMKFTYIFLYFDGKLMIVAKHKTYTFLNLNSTTYLMIEFNDTKPKPFFIVNVRYHN